jgi:hypothetical protein
MLLMIFTCPVKAQVEKAEENENPLESLELTEEESILIEITEENEKLKKELEDLDLNEVTLRQMGERNSADITQVSDPYSNPNLIRVQQNGSENAAVVIQEGNQNALDLEQSGKGNQYRGEFEGELLINTVIQKGNQNILEQYLSGNTMNFFISQEGTGHELIQKESSDGIGYKVMQKGQGMKVQIEQGHAIIK